ncbi:MAG: hypothetical protein ABIP81_03935 [Terriglobales bacterium]
MRKTAALTLFCLLSTANVWTQSQPLPDKPQPQTSSPTDAAKPERILWLIPSYDIANARAPYTPLTPREKFSVFTNSTFDRITPVTAAFDAGINQATNTPPGYGQGGEGYAKRYGAAIGDKVASDFLGKFFFPVIFRQDPRYFALQEGTGGRRIGYAMSRVFVTRGDSGRSQFNASQVLGAFSSAAMTNIWYPPADRKASTTLTRAGTRLALSMGFNIAKEFWPEIRGRMGMKK